MTSKPLGDQMSAEERALLEQIDRNRLPRHVAIIMDGNGRWARLRNHSRIKGHKASIPAVQSVVKSCHDLGIGHLTLYAFSTENWKRPPQETGSLMALLRQFLRLEFNMVNRYDIRFMAIGDVSSLAPGIQRDIDRVVQATRDHEGMRFNLALNYSGRQDILMAIRRASAAGESMASMDEERFNGYLQTAGQPDPDLVIRTSGEHRISNFLLWQIAYSEIWVTPTYWPDFRPQHLYQAIIDFQGRHRRFGGI